MLRRVCALYITVPSCSEQHDKEGTIVVSSRMKINKKYERTVYACPLYLSSSWRHGVVEVGGGVGCDDGGHSVSVSRLDLQT